MSVSNLRSTTAATIRGARVSAAAGGDAPIKTLSFEIAVATGSIADMQDLSQSFTKKIELEKRRCEDLNNRLKVLLGKLAESRKQMPVTAEPESARQQAAKLQVLEHRLNKLTEKQNHAETVNSSMRQEVDDLRRKKLQQHRIRTNMESEIAKAKRSLVASLQTLRQAVSARDKGQRDMLVLQSTIEKETEEFEAEFRLRVEELTSEKGVTLTELDRRAHAAVGGEIGGTGDVPRAPSPVSGRSPAGEGKWGGIGLPAGLDVTIPSSNPVRVEAEDDIRHKSTRTCWEIARQEVDLRKQSALLASYTDAFRKIQSDTGITTVEDMTSEFLFAEERNFSLINMINDLNKEVEILEAENSALRVAVDSARESGKQTEASKSAVFQGLDAQVLDIERRAQHFHRKHEQTAAFVDALKPHVVGVLQKILPASASGSDQLSEGVITESTIMSYMALLEHRVTELVQMVHASKVGYSLTSQSNPGGPDAVEAHRLLSKLMSSSVTIGTSKSSVREALPVRLPSIGDSDSEDESLVFGGGPAAFRASSVRPVSLEHLKFNASKVLEHKRTKLAAHLYSAASAPTSAANLFS